MGAKRQPHREIHVFISLFVENSLKFRNMVVENDGVFGRSAISACGICECGALSHKQRGTKEVVAVEDVNKKNIEWNAVDKNWYPNWRNKAEYEGYGKWSDRRWAWEFLRRNPDYRALCDEIVRTAGPLQRAAFASLKSRAKAEKFGRIDLKNYKSSYGNDDQKVHWIAEAATPADWDSQQKVQNEPWSIDETASVRKVELVFDINEVLVAGAAVLDAFLHQARHHLTESLNQYKAELSSARRRQEPEKIKKRRGGLPRGDERRLLLLRTYDATELEGLKGPKVIDVLYAHVKGDQTDPEGPRTAKLKRYSACLDDARQIVSGRYREFVPQDILRNNSPKPADQASKGSATD
jgi:hypothetical protein